VIRSSFQRIATLYLYFGCLVGTSKCKGSREHHVLQVNLVEYKTGKREYTRIGWDTAKLTLICFTKTSRIYTRARMNNSRFSVYRGDFRKSIKACEFTHVGVFMRTRRADSRFAASRISCRYQAGNAGAYYDLVCMPAMRDFGSLHSSPLCGKRN